jgi:Ran GTPase-activating protein (RanGAP) involved in mRNA processing and transport
MTNLINMLKETDNHIKVLALVNAKIPEHSIAKLAEMMEESDRLRELDLSWNIMRPKSYARLLTALGENRKLTSVNLSYNTLIDQAEI